MIESLDKDFQLTVTVEIIDRRGGWSAVAITVAARIGKSNVMQQAATLLDHVPHVNPDPELNAAVLGQLSISLLELLLRRYITRRHHFVICRMICYTPPILQ